MRKFSLMVFFLVPIVLISCRKSESDCFVNAGKIVTETRQTGPFSSIKILDNVDVELVEGLNGSVEVEAGENLISGIEMAIEDAIVLIDSVPVSTRQLVIRNTTTCNWSRSYEQAFLVKIPVHGLMSIDYRSIGNLHCVSSIRSDTFLINILEWSGDISLKINNKLSYLNFHFGTADLYAEGFSEISYVYQASYGPVHAENLETNFMYLENKGSNYCFVNAKIFLGATISSIGNVYYTGNPQGTSLVNSGSGNFYAFP